MSEVEPATRARLAPLVIAVAAAVVMADQLTKTWALHALEPKDIDLFWTLRLHLTRNRGAAFSFSFALKIPLVFDEMTAIRRHFPLFPCRS